MKKVSVLIAFLFAALMLEAQAYKGSGGAFSIGIQSMNTDNLPLITNVDPELEEIGFNFGGYVYWQLNRFTLGLKGYGVYGTTSNFGDYQYNLSGGAALAEVGYKVLYGEKFSLFPFAGAGYGGVRYALDDTRNIDLSGGPVQEPLATSTTASMGGFVFDFGIRCEAYLFFEDNEPSVGLLGLEAGYQMAAPRNNWTTNGGGNITGVENDYQFDGWFVKLTIGGFEGFFEK